MNKITKIIIAVVAVLLGGALIYGVSFLLTPRYVKEISYDEYKNLNTSSSYVYIGNKSDKELLEDMAKDNKLQMYYINSEKLTDEEKENLSYSDEGLLLEDKNGEAKNIYEGSIDSYLFDKSLMSNSVIGKNYITIDADEYVEIIKQDKYNMVVIGQTTCGYCKQYKPELTEVLKDYDVNIYYIDINVLPEEDYMKIKATDEYFQSDDWGTPLSFLYKNGKRLGVINGYRPKDDIVEFLKTNGAI